MTTRITLQTAWTDDSASVVGVALQSLADSVSVNCRLNSCTWQGNRADGIQVEWDHFIPYLSIDRGLLGPRSRQRAWYNAWLVLFAQPLEDLKELLGSFQFLGSTRQPPPSLYRPATVPSRDIGVSGEYAAQILHRRRQEAVYYLPPLRVTDGGVEVPVEVLQESLIEAVNYVLRELSIVGEVRIEDVRDVGFKLLFGNASLGHVGRGLTYLLPLVQLGLILDPYVNAPELRGGWLEDGEVVPIGNDLPLADYLQRCTSTAHFALEEPESHLHPKVQSRLAHWLVSLAMCNRRMMVETHSDHLVRRLRGLIARSAPAGELERWLLENVVVLEVNQAEDGSSSVTSSRLTREGSLSESWPADFMDEASEEDTAIFQGALTKTPRRPRRSASFIHDEGDEDAP